MQKSQRKWSILLWSMSISLILVFLFVSFSTKLSEKIRLEKSLVWYIRDIFLRDGFTLWTGSSDSIRLDKVNQSIYGMQQSENHEFRFETIKTFLITVTLQKWGPLSFKFVAFSWQTLMGWVSASGYTDSSISFTGNLNSQYDKGILYIKNLWGYSSYILTSGEPYTSSNQNYKAIRVIGWDDKVEKNISHKQFTPWDWGEVDYDALDMKF